MLAAGRMVAPLGYSKYLPDFSATGRLAKTRRAMKFSGFWKNATDMVVRSGS